MRMIAEKAGRPLSLLSHYFKNKEGLYLEVFTYVLESSAHHPAAFTPGKSLGPQDRPEAIRLLREQIHLMFERAAPKTGLQNPLDDCRARLWVQEFRTTRPSLHTTIRQYLSPDVEMIQSCIRVLRPDLNESQVVFLGITVIGQVVCHGIMSGLNKVIWGDPPPLGSHFQEAEFLVDFCLHGLCPGAPAD